MPRKRSASGRAKPITIQSNIQLQTEKINKMIRSLEKGKNYGTYKSKELIRFANQNDNLTLKKSRGSKRHRLTVQALREATFGKLAIISKIGPSEFFAMVTQARDTSMDQEQWLEMLNNYVSINNEAMRQASEYLYNKYIK